MPFVDVNVLTVLGRPLEVRHFYILLFNFKQIKQSSSATGIVVAFDGALSPWLSIPRPTPSAAGKEDQALRTNRLSGSGQRRGKTAKSPGTSQRCTNEAHL